MSFLQLFIIALVIHSHNAMGSSFQPYILAEKNSNLDEKSVQDQLKHAGFEVLGTTYPAKGYTTVTFSHPDLKKEAAKAVVPLGAVLRASLVQTKAGTEVSYCSPHWWAYATRLAGSSSDKLARKLADTFGNESSFGCANGRTESKLRNFNYAMGMPRVSDVDVLSTFDSQLEAILALNQNIKSSPHMDIVYSLDIDKKTRLIGVHLKDGKGSDETVISVADALSNPKQGGLYGPYEIYIQNGKVMAPRGRFRIAVAFPDLSMSTFMKIVAAPGAILDAFKSVADKKAIAVK
jgi:hypothetical protein